ncbi:hypothetical protein HPB48_019868 [Haemaphysalis longicornis]|uniref:Uncharacterized protein n=1 Tax=Haemaphysalis longicornis TaxID=44386 RepID=A0A9J6FZ67_HAELO|nr:hypothetical protein HPB48_019868 [Haemaphysalis longicornis]
MKKTVFMRMTRKKAPFQFCYQIDNTPLKEVAEYKYPGIYITRTLNWTVHGDYICDRARKKLWALRRNLHDATTEVKLLAYKTTIMPPVDYASPVWHPRTENNIMKCESIQNKALRLSSNAIDITTPGKRGNDDCSPQNEQ